ncbi:unnamed protein product [Gongylonema pulchrum]|uniref:Carboxylic ester hydrolase n=1 Tax=Gongylonema pulchrum TaxID=637853 RepID=A0A183CY63_9BILA|nr:unnamed protein product [Gongylonema pulchrum]
MALKWVTENIEYFGGDRNRITVVGQSAGAVSADLLTLIPQSKDLFHRVVLLGGNAECPWAVSDSKKVANYCRRHVEKLGWRGKDDTQLMEFLRGLPAAKLGDGMIGNKEMFSTGRLPLTPVIDGDLIPCTVAELRKQAPTKPSLVGLTEDEGLLFVAMGHMACDMKDIELGVRIVAEAVEGSDANVRQFINEIYLNRGNGNLSDKSNIRRAFIDMLGDLTSNYGTSLYVEKLIERGETVYMFSLEHCNPACYGLLNFYLPYKKATHGTELIYLFDVNIYMSPFFKTAVDKQISRFMTHSISNFVKTGDPNSVGDNVDGKQCLWKPATMQAKEQHLRIAEVSAMRDEFKNGRMKRLKNVFGSAVLK